MQIAERVHSLAKEQDDPALMIWAYNALACTLYCSDDFESAQQYATRGVEIWGSRGGRPHPEEVDTPVVGCLCYGAMCAWHLGEIASSHASIAQAISLAKELNDMPALAMALSWAASLAYNRSNPAEVARLASDVTELSATHNFGYWLAVGTIWRGWASSVSGDIKEGIPWIEQGIRDLRATGSIIGLPIYLVPRAEALHLADRTSEALETINEAETLAERFEHRANCAELHRLRGVFLAGMGVDEAEVETLFCQAIKIATKQKSISLRERAEATREKYCAKKRQRITFLPNTRVF
jgi:hypothetical protein